MDSIAGRLTVIPRLSTRLPRAWSLDHSGMPGKARPEKSDLPAIQLSVHPSNDTAACSYGMELDLTQHPRASFDSTPMFLLCSHEAWQAGDPRTGDFRHRNRRRPRRRPGKPAVARCTAPAGMVPERGGLPASG